MTPAFAALYESQEWTYTRYRIIRRDKGACTVCGAKQILQVHHEKYIGDHPSDTPDEYLKTLCHHCHAKAHNTKAWKEPFMSIGEIIDGWKQK